MSIRNNKVGGTDYTRGESVYPNDINDTFNAIYTLVSAPITIQSGLNNIRQLIDRDTKINNNITEGITEAYISTTGRRSSISTSDTTSYHGSNLQYAYTNDGSVSIYGNLFGAEETSTEEALITDINKGIASVSNILHRSTFGLIYCKIKYYYSDGTTAFTSELGTPTGGTIDAFPKTYDNPNINKIVSSIGIWLRLSNSSYTTYCSSNTAYELGISDPSIISHTLNPLYLKDGINNSMCVPLIDIDDINTDNINIKYKLYNSTTDTGWLTAHPPSIEQFTEFDTKPTTLDVQLTRVGSTYPHLRGVYLYGNN